MIDEESMYRAACVAYEYLEKDQVDVLGLAEERDGGGWSLIIQVPRRESDEAEEGYCLCNELGYTHYGGLNSVAVDRTRHQLSIELSTDAAEVLGVPDKGTFFLDVPVSEELAFYAKLIEVLGGAGVPVRGDSASEGNSMGRVQVTVKPFETSRDYVEPLQSWLREDADISAANISISATDSGELAFDVSDVDDCSLVGMSIARWVATTPADYKLMIKGPGIESSVMHSLGAEWDGDMISGMLASAADFR